MRVLRKGQSELSVGVVVLLSGFIVWCQRMW